MGYFMNSIDIRNSLLLNLKINLEMVRNKLCGYTHSNITNYRATKVISHSVNLFNIVSSYRIVPPRILREFQNEFVQTFVFSIKF